MLDKELTLLCVNFALYGDWKNKMSWILFCEDLSFLSAKSEEGFVWCKSTTGWI